MTLYLVIASSLISIAWMPLALRFYRGWRNRKNPVSLAICAATLFIIYNNVIFALAMLGETTWRFYAIADHVFGLIVVVNFYVAFRWSDTKFENTRQLRIYTVPPTKTVVSKTADE